MNTSNGSANALLSLVTLLACVLTAAGTRAEILFRDDAPALGVDFVWHDSWLYGDLGSGVALEDLEGDGDLDLFLGTKAGEPLRVYRNDGDRFVDVSAELAIGGLWDVKQVLFADLDDDGRRDLVLSHWIPLGFAFSGGRLTVHRNLGDGSFSEVTSAPLDSVTAGLPTGIAAGDVDLDGDLDLYVSVWKAGVPDETSRNRLLRNDGGFSFTDVGGALGVDDRKKSYQPVLTDLSGDGWLDIVVAEDKKGGMTYYESDGAGGFVDRTVVSGLDGYIGPPGTDDSDLYIDGMGIGVGDHDNDGDLDLYVTNVFDGNVLYQNDGDGTFSEIAVRTGTVNYRVGWGCGFLDLDHDGWLDLYVVDFGMGSALDQDKVDRVYRNLGPGPTGITYEDVAPRAGVTAPDDGFGMAAGDLDLDGDLDVVVSNGDAPLRIYRNVSADTGHWIALHLEGTASNRDGVGARVELSAGGRTWIREQRAGTSYLSFDSHALEFGLGSATLVDRITVAWPSGQVDEWTEVPVDTRLLLVEGGDATVDTPLPPRVRGDVEADGFTLRWRDDRSRWQRFDVERLRAGRLEPVGSVPVEPGRSDYHWSTTDAREGDRFTVFAVDGTTRLAAETVVYTLPRAVRLQVAAPTPNPFNPRTVLRYRAPAGADVRLRIVDGRGRTVRHLPAAESGGWAEVVWNGADDDGRPVASGSYRFVVEADGQGRSVPLTLVR